MLEDEYGRCREVIEALHAKAENYPKGALNVRKKQSKGKEYVYHYLVRRDGKKVVNRHIAEKDLPELQKQIEERDKYRKEIIIYKKRMVYLERLLRWLKFANHSYGSSRPWLSSARSPPCRALPNRHRDDYQDL